MSTEVIIGIWAACAVLGAVIGSSKGKGVTGFVLGAVLGVIGLIIVVLLKPAPTSEPLPAGGWWPDPYDRYAKRFYDGTTWTNHVITVDGTQTVETFD